MKTRVNVFFSTLNFVLIFIGYPLVTSILLPVSDDLEGVSRLVTIPYRAFSLLISIIVILMNILKPKPKKSFALKVFIVFWIMLLIRIFYDLEIKIYFVSIQNTLQLWLYLFAIGIPLMISIFFSYKHIDFHKAFNWIFYGLFLFLLITLSSHSFLDSNDESRESANVALNTITFGQLAAMEFILAKFLYTKSSKVIYKILLIMILLLSFFILLKAGSRGPIISLMIVLLFWIFARGKNIYLSFTIFIFIIGFIYLFLDTLIEYLSIISPIMAKRLNQTIYEGDTGQRDGLYVEALQSFYNYPILGEKFAIINKYGELGYSHNIITDALMGLGIIGGGVLVYILIAAIMKSYKCIHFNDQNYWLFLILIFQISSSMTSGTIYYNIILNALLIIVFCKNIKVHNEKIEIT